ncbi:coiled-coil domain-containing protein 12 isoform X2 [Hylobates moloch]|uniref:coiled-coil domain-containing protein 12 isoform X2 n=1 Tax=Hylobates moloch TaxID=81572 RepID=UPI0013620472|nr:coiled-coil domain-containing protein 12 isoform X2 [Hylobates moloch]XP_058298016.1 coiled-coil domain-containing protein 12 isoform X2 [Hylobates moloch]
MGRAAREGAPPPCPTSAIGKANLSLRDEGRGLRDARREKRRGVGGQDGGDYGWCGPARGRGVAAKGTAEGPTGENRAQGQGRWGAKDQASQRRGGRRREAQGLRERTHVEKKIGSAAVPEMKGPRQMEQGQALEAIPRELRLRNYVPEDEDLKKRRVPQAKPVAVEEKVKEQLEAAKPEPVIEEVDLANLAPRKPDWDLKRDVAKKLEKLKKRTQRAIAELIRERLKGQEDSLASAVDAATEQKACDSD